jgi:uncharacterized protein (DUF433 family)
MSRTMALTADVVTRLTGLSEHQLRRWDVEGFIVPSLADPNRRTPHSRIYSFQDLVALRTIAEIMDRGVPIRRLKELGKLLRELPDTSWASTRFFVRQGNVYFNYRDALVSAKPHAGQQAFREIEEVGLEPIVLRLQQQVAKLRTREPEDIGRVSRSRFIMGGQPVIAGTRITTAMISGLVQDGFTVEQILKEYPRLTPEDIQAAVRAERETAELFAARAG